MTMKKFLILVAIAGSLSACNNSSTSGSGTDSTDKKLDSLEERKDTLVNNVDSTTDAKIDSLKDKAKNLKEKFDSSFKERKDSIKGKKG
jgi:peptidoglycan hydrolase CwlO-like protein